MYSRFLFYLSIFGLMASLPGSALASEQDELFLLDPVSQSKKGAPLSISYAVDEWNITFNADSVNSESEVFSVSLPHQKKGDVAFSVIRTSYSSYENGNTQWAGSVMFGKGAEREQIGYTIVNMIDNKPSGIIKVNGKGYEISTNQSKNTTLIKTPDSQNLMDDSFKPDAHDDHMDESFVGDNYKGSLLANMSEIPGTSVVDVLVVIDQDLVWPGAPIFQKIIDEKMNADLILADSGPNGVGVPLKLNLLPYQYIDIPAQYENISFVNGSWASDDYLRNGVSPESIQLRNMFTQSGADVIALYIPFDPDVLGTDACGKAEIPRSNFEEQQDVFYYAFAFNASVCTLDQFVFLHEFMHGFGSAHSQGNTRYFEPYSRGMNIFNSKAGDFSTMMGCTGNSGDPSVIGCNRIPHLSSPDVIVNGRPIGFVSGNPNSRQNADNVRFLTECELNGPCRRGEVANRGTATAPVDFIPTVTITTPIDNEVIAAGTQYDLTANAADDYGIVSANWTISDLGTTPPTEVDAVNLNVSGTNPDVSYTTSALINPGQYLVSATVEDDIGQVKTDSHTVTVINPEISIITPTDNLVLPVTSSYLLSVEVPSGLNVTSVDWIITEFWNKNVIDSKASKGAVYDMNTGAFASPGNYFVTAVVFYGNGQSVADTHTVIVDSVPDVNILTPANQAVITPLGPNETYELTTTVYDDFSIDEVSWTVTSLASNQVVDLGTGSDSDPYYNFSTDAFTASGIFVVEAAVVDSFGQTDSDTHQVRVDAFPEVSIITPVDASTILTTNSFDLTAQASDDFVLNSVEWQVLRADNNQVVDSGMGNGQNFDFNTDAFADAGNYVIKATATDSINQQTTDTHLITVNATADIAVSMTYTGALPTVKVQNNGPNTATDVTFRIRATPNSTSTYVDIGDLPPGCNSIINSFPWSSNVLEKHYECTVDVMDDGAEVEIVWNLICTNNGFTSDQIDFSVQLISINETEVNPFNNGAYQFFYNNICLY